MSLVLFELLQFALLLAAAPLLTGLVRKMKARLNGRVGPSMLQPYRDLWRLLALSRRPLHRLRGHLGRRGIGANVRDRPRVLLVG